MLIISSQGTLEYTSKSSSYRIWHTYPLHTKIHKKMFKRYVYKFRGQVFEEYSSKFKELVEQELVWQLLLAPNHKQST